MRYTGPADVRVTGFKFDSSAVDPRGEAYSDRPMIPIEKVSLESLDVRLDKVLARLNELSEIVGELEKYVGVVQDKARRIDDDFNLRYLDKK